MNKHTKKPFYNSNDKSSSGAGATKSSSLSAFASCFPVFSFLHSTELFAFTCLFFSSFYQIWLVLLSPLAWFHASECVFGLLCYPSSSISSLLDLLQFQHPFRHITSTNLHHVRNRPQHRLVVFRKQRDCLPFSPRTPCSPDPMDIINSALHAIPSSFLPAENRN